jgi:hypothetical protein
LFEVQGRIFPQRSLQGVGFARLNVVLAGQQQQVAAGKPRLHVRQGNAHGVSGRARRRPQGERPRCHEKQALEKTFAEHMKRRNRIKTSWSGFSAKVVQASAEGIKGSLEVN